MPVITLDHIIWCNIYPFLEHLQGCFSSPKEGTFTTSLSPHMAPPMQTQNFLASWVCYTRHFHPLLSNGWKIVEREKKKKDMEYLKTSFNSTRKGCFLMVNDFKEENKACCSHSPSVVCTVYMRDEQSSRFHCWSDSRCALQPPASHHQLGHNPLSSGPYGHSFCT